MEKLKVLTKNGFEEIDRNDVIEKIEKGEFILSGENFSEDLVYEPRYIKPFYDTIEIYPQDNRLMVIIKNYIIKNKIDMYKYFNNFKSLTEFNNFYKILLDGGKISYDIFKKYLDVFNLDCTIELKEKCKLTATCNINDMNKRTSQEFSSLYEKIQNLNEEESQDIILKYLKHNGLILKYIKDQTREMCLAAVKQDGDALVFVKEQDDEICMAAVKQLPYAIRYVENQTEEICLEAVKKYYDAIHYIKNPTDKVTQVALFSKTLENNLK